MKYLLPVVLVVYLLGALVSYGHSYWKFQPCQKWDGDAGSLALMSAVLWPMYVSYIVFAPVNYPCGEHK